MEFFQQVELAESQSRNASMAEAAQPSVAAAPNAPAALAIQPVAQAQPAYPAAIEPSGPGYTAAWCRLWKTWEVSRQACKMREQEVGEVFDTSLTMLNVKPLREIRNTLVWALVAKAQREFTLPGEKLAIATDEVKRALGPVGGAFPGIDRHLWTFDASYSTVDSQTWEEICSVAFDPDAVWAWLEQKYGGQARQQRLYGQAAAALVKHLGLGTQMPGEKQGKLLVTVDARSEKIVCSADLPQRRCFSDATRDVLNGVRNALAVVAEWGEDAATAAALSGDEVGALARRGPFDSRDAHRFGGIEWMFFSSRVDIVFADRLGVKFRQFIAQFGKPATGGDRAVSYVDATTKPAFRGASGGVMPKYRDPETGQCWSGRGLRPRWVVQAMESGKTLQDLVVV